MRCVAYIHLDTKTSDKTKKVRMAYEDRGLASDKIVEILDKTARSRSSMARIRDVKTGDYVFVNTMKISDIDVVMEEE